MLVCICRQILLIRKSSQRGLSPFIPLTRVSHVDTSIFVKDGKCGLRLLLFWSNTQKCMYFLYSHSPCSIPSRSRFCPNEYRTLSTPHYTVFCGIGSWRYRASSGDYVHGLFPRWYTVVRLVFGIFSVMILPIVMNPLSKIF